MMNQALLMKKLKLWRRIRAKISRLVCLSFIKIDLTIWHVGLDDEITVSKDKGKGKAKAPESMFEFYNLTFENLTRYFR